MTHQADDSPSAPLSPLGPVKIAVTVDDMLLLRGSPHAPGHDPVSTVHAFMTALAAHRIGGVYQFSNTAPLEDDRQLFDAFDLWFEGGHHVGNHTHHHLSLNWIGADDYAREIELAEAYLGKYIAAAPRRLFRFCGDFWGNTACKCRSILEHLERMNYTPIPVSIGFHDFDWNAAYARVTKRGSADELACMQRAYTESAVSELRLGAANARAVFGHDPAHIWLIHGTSIAADCLEAILDRFREIGAEFVSLDEAMADPINAEIPPRISEEFIFQVEKWALALNVPIDFPHREVLDRIEKLQPMPGEMHADIMKEMVAQMQSSCGLKLSLGA